jgi:hypothetical protein
VIGKHLTYNAMTLKGMTAMGLKMFAMPRAKQRIMDKIPNLCGCPSEQVSAKKA